MTPEERKIDEILDKVMGNPDTMPLESEAEAKASLLQMFDLARLDELNGITGWSESRGICTSQGVGSSSAPQTIKDRKAELSASANAGRQTPNPKEKES